MFHSSKPTFTYSLLLACVWLAGCDNGVSQFKKIIEANEEFKAINYLYKDQSIDPSKIQIMIKDNIDIIGAPNTAGSQALVANFPSEDASLVKQLKRSNYQVIGKTNLSEWANFRSFNSISGWSSYGGQTQHALGNNLNPCGSSSGSAVVVALGLVKASIGTETNGSISCPASVNGIVGIKPTVGLVSRIGIIPISPTQDTAGPMAVNVSEAAKLLSSISKEDPMDAATLLRPENFDTNFEKDLVEVSLANYQFGLLPSGNDDPEAKLLLDKISELITQAGGNIVNVTEIPSYPGEEELFVLLYEFKYALEAYLKSSNSEFKTLTSIMEFNEKNSSSVLEYFDQSIFEASLEASSDHAKYDESLEKVLSISRNFIESTIDEQNLSALIGLTRGPAWKIDSENGDNGALENYPSWGNGGFAAMAGTPHITIPLGKAYGLPIGLSIMGKAWSDHEMIQLAYTLEQLLK
jgi:amidase